MRTASEGIESKEAVLVVEMGNCCVNPLSASGHFPDTPRSETPSHKRWRTPLAEGGSLLAGAPVKATEPRSGRPKQRKAAHAPPAQLTLAGSMEIKSPNSIFNHWL